MAGWTYETVPLYGPGGYPSWDLWTDDLIAAARVLAGAPVVRGRVLVSQGEVRPGMQQAPLWIEQTASNVLGHPASAARNRIPPPGPDAWTRK